MSKISTIWSDIVPDADNWLPKYEKGDVIKYQGEEYTISGRNYLFYEVMQNGKVVGELDGLVVDYGAIYKKPKNYENTRWKMKHYGPARHIQQNPSKKKLEEIRENQSDTRKKIVDSGRIYPSASTEGGRKRKTRRNTKRRKSNRRR